MHSDLATPLARLQAPAAWQRLEFISDLHLSEADPLTFDTWQAYLQTCTADALFILGDLFEAWIGDDVLEPTQGFAFERQCVALLRKASQKRPVYLLHGNRDFLLGDHFFNRSGVQALADPCPLVLGGHTVLLSHGDALCTNDTAYMQLRGVIRSAPWQQATLAKPLAERMAMVAQIKMDKAERAGPAAPWMDVDTQAAIDCLNHFHASELVHGHTHLPADHEFPGGLMRRVLSDWEGHQQPQRAQVLRWEAGKWLRLSPQNAVR